MEYQQLLFEKLPRVCLVCGVNIENKIKSAKCCSQKCSHRNHYINNKEHDKNLSNNWNNTHPTEVRINNIKYRKRKKELAKKPENKKRLAEYKKEYYKNNKNKYLAQYFIHNHPEYQIKFCEIGPTCIWCAASDKVNNHHVDQTYEDVEFFKVVIGFCKGGHKNIHSLINRGIIRQFSPGEDFIQYKQHALEKLRVFQQDFLLKVNEINRMEVLEEYGR